MTHIQFKKRRVRSRFPTMEFQTKFADRNLPIKKYEVPELEGKWVPFLVDGNYSFNGKHPERGYYPRKGTTVDTKFYSQDKQVVIIECARRNKVGKEQGQLNFNGGE